MCIQKRFVIEVNIHDQSIYDYHNLFIHMCNKYFNRGAIRNKLSWFLFCIFTLILLPCFLSIVFFQNDRSIDNLTCLLETNKYPNVKLYLLHLLEYHDSISKEMLYATQCILYIFILILLFFYDSLKI